MNIHPTTILSPETRPAERVEMGPFCLTEGRVQLGPGVKLHSHVVLYGPVDLEEGVTVDPFCVIGGRPQNLGSLREIASGVRIGAHTCLREGVTLHRPTEEDGWTTVGSRCLLMGGCHVGHDGSVGHSVVMANGCALGGHVSVGDHAFLGGGAMVHQHVRIGEGAMIAGGSEVSYDVPPYCLTSGRNLAHGLNLVGLRRLEKSRVVISELKTLFRLLILGKGSMESRLEQTFSELGGELSPEGERFRSFFKSSKRGFIQPVRS